MIWWDLHVWWLWADLRQGLARGTPWDHPAKTHLAGSHLPESKKHCTRKIRNQEAGLLSTTLEVQTCSNLYRTLQHQKDSWQSTPHVCFLFLHRLHQFFVFLLVKRPLFPIARTKTPSTTQPSSHHQFQKTSSKSHPFSLPSPKKSYPPPKSNMSMENHYL